MKRSPIGPKSFAEALAKQQAKRIAQPIQMRPRACPAPQIAPKPQSQAASQGKIRSKAKKAEKDKKLSEFRCIVRERDDFTCQWPGCGYQDKNIDVQHIAKRSQRPDLIYDSENGVCLCRTHHNFADNTSQGRKLAKEYNLAGGETYEMASKAT